MGLDELSKISEDISLLLKRRNGMVYGSEDISASVKITILFCLSWHCGVKRKSIASQMNNSRCKECNSRES